MDSNALTVIRPFTYSGEMHTSRQPRRKAAQDTRTLSDLVSVGKATIADLKKLGITTVAALKNQDPVKLYKQLCRITGVKHDICCLDVFQAAIAQSKNKNLPVNMRQWWYWSRVRKEKVTPAT